MFFQNHSRGNISHKETKRGCKKFLGVKCINNVENFQKLSKNVPYCNCSNNSEFKSSLALLTALSPKLDK